MYVHAETLFVELSLYNRVCKDALDCFAPAAFMVYIVFNLQETIRFFSLCIKADEHYW